MTPGTYDLALYRGDTYSWRFVLWQDDQRSDPVDLTGAQAAAEIRDKPSGAKIVPLDVAITAPNLIDVSLPASRWAGTFPLAGQWDLEVTFADTSVSTVVRGTVAVTADITHSTPVPA
jgi:hypothetical protein